MRTPALLVAVSALTLATLVGCGGDEGSTASDPQSSTPATSATPEPAAPSGPSESPDPSGSASAAAKPLPACGDVWVAGVRLPRRYAGCQEQDAVIEPDGIDCSSGQKIIRYADRFYAVAGGPVVEVPDLTQDTEYQEMIEVCRG